MKSELFFDHLVIGSGIAGLSTALKLASLGSVAIVTKKEAIATNTNFAQGGIACVIDDKDSYNEHIKDTIEAGAGMCNKNIVEKIIHAGPEAINELITYGAHFTTRGEMGDQRHKEDLHLGLEGGHHIRRIIHAKDITGAEIQKTLLDASRRNPNITIFEDHAAIDLITSKKLGWLGKNQCLGAYVFDSKNEAVKTFLAMTTTLAAGGAGKVYLYTSNPDIACGSGIAMAYRAGVPIENMEFFQFHPTILYNPPEKGFLISEAVRGEGGVLKIKDKKGKLVEFMHKYHKMGSLAPRDIVARAIDKELKMTGEDCVYIDIRNKESGFLENRFPAIFAECKKAGVDMNKDPIPVVPAAHYCCGGIKVDENGFTGIDGLYAAGENASNCFHGANRLASNSLLESLVVPFFILEDVRKVIKKIVASRSSGNVPEWESKNAIDSDELIVIHHNWDEIRRFMWDYVGIFRTNKRLERAKVRVRNIRKEIEKYYWDFFISLDLLELRDLSTVSEIIIDSALIRKESRGLHYNADYPERETKLDNINTIITRTSST